MKVWIVQALTDDGYTDDVDGVFDTREAAESHARFLYGNNGGEVSDVQVVEWTVNATGAEAIGDTLLLSS